MIGEWYYPLNAVSQKVRTRQKPNTKREGWTKLGVVPFEIGLHARISR